MLFLKRMLLFVYLILSFITIATASESDNKSIVPIISFMLYEQEFEFTSNLVIFPDTIFSGKSSSVIASIALKNATSYEDIELWKTSKYGTFIKKVAILKDNGDADIGDEIKGDGIFHGKVTLMPSELGKDYYTAYYKGAVSEPAVVSLLPELSDVSLNQASIQVNNAKSIYENIVNWGGSTQSAQDAVQNMLSVESNILQYGKADDNYGSWWVTKEGIVVIHDPATEDSANRSSSSYFGRVPEQPVPNNLGSPVLPINKSNINIKNNMLQEAVKFERSDDISKRIGSKDALLLENYSFGGNELSHIENVLKNTGMKVTFISEGNVTLDHYKNFSKYGVISIVSHGSSYFSSLKSSLFGLVTWWDEEWGNLNEAGWPTISMPIDKTDAMKEDIAAGRLAVRSSGKISILPSFVLHYNKNLPESIIWMGICQGAYNNKLGQSFTARGASAFFGFSDTVKSSFAQTHGEGLFDHLVQDKTAGTYPGIGKNDGDDTPAELKFIGDENIKLIDPSLLENGDFESGALNSWNPSGDVRVIQKLQILSPPQGSYMAMLTTGVGAKDGSTSILIQKIRPSIAKHILKFRYDFVSEEPMEWVNSSFDDKFELTVGGDVTVIENVNKSKWIELGGDYFQGGDYTTFHTGWKEFTIDLSEHIGSLIDLQFKVYDVGDSQWDSAALIDNIRME